MLRVIEREMERDGALGGGGGGSKEFSKKKHKSKKMIEKRGKKITSKITTVENHIKSTSNHSSRSSRNHAATALIVIEPSLSEERAWTAPIFAAALFLSLALFAPPSSPRPLRCLDFKSPYSSVPATADR